MSVRVIHGDCRDVLSGFNADTFHAVCCDPPYHLTSIVKRFGATSQGDKTKTSDRARRGADGMARLSRGFMGKTWDGGDIAFQAEMWAEVLRVMKPGAHLVAFGGTRTFHRMAVAIEDAGFEIRDTLMWLYGSGFPKSHDVAKGIERRRVEDAAPVRAVCRAIRAAMDSAGIKAGDLTGHFGGCHSRLIDHWAARDTDSQPALPTVPQWETLRAVLGMDDSLDGEVRRLNARKGTPGATWEAREITGTVDEWENRSNYALTSRDGLRRDKAATPEAAAWEGWGTALKPAWEPIILARKPLAGTVAANVLAHGTGALNVGACRIGDEVRTAAYTSLAPCHGNALGAAGTAEARCGTQGAPVDYVGRWPTNVLHDGSPEVLEAFAAFGESKSTAQPRNNGAFKSVAKGRETARISHGHGDSGSAARFFYTAKADAADRLQSKHPTVKPVDLIRYLVKLITPPGGHILDCFAGSGTTGMAAMAEGFDATLIEMEAEYVADIERRISHVYGNDTPLFSGLFDEAVP